MNTLEPIYQPAIDWLLSQPDPEIRLLTRLDLLHTPADDPQIRQLVQESLTTGLTAQVLEQMHPDGYWEKPGPGYLPKYRSTVWSLVLLASFGAKVDWDPRIQTACDYFLREALTEHGQISASGAPSGTADCLQGNICWAFNQLGFQRPELDLAFLWMARSVTGEGVAAKTEKNAALRYYASQCGPRFACGSNIEQPCAWGGVKVMKAFSVLPKEKHTTLIQKAIQTGIDFFLSIDPTTGEYPHPMTNNPSGNWWKFGFPLFYVSDLLEITEFMLPLGYGSDPRLKNLFDLIKNKQDDQGRWVLEYDYAGKTWLDFGKKKQPNPWVTLRALRVLSQIS